MAREQGDSSNGADFQADESVVKRSRLIPQFFRRPENPNSLGLYSEGYTQPEDPIIGFSPEAIREARLNQVLSEKVIVVVGIGSRGIGEASLIESAIQGATLIGVSRKPNDDPYVKDLMIRASNLSGKESKWLSADVTEDSATDTIINGTVEKYGRLDGIVIAQAITDDKEFTEYTRQEFEEVMDTDFKASVWLIQESLKQMKKQGSGKVVFVSSVSAIGTPGQAPYAASKNGVEAIIRGLPPELSRQRGRVTVNAVASGFVAETGITGILDNKKQDRILQFSEADRALHPAEVAEFVVHLLNPNILANGKIVPIVGRGPVPPTGILGITLR